VLKNIEQNNQVWHHSIEKVISEISAEMAKQRKLIDALFTPVESKYILVPDTNALLLNPNLDKWEFTDITQFEIVMMPSVLSELDHLKLFGRNELVRNGANKMVNQLKEYKRRGRLSEGVALVKGKS